MSISKTLDTIGTVGKDQSPVVARGEALRSAHCDPADSGLSRQLKLPRSPYARIVIVRVDGLSVTFLHLHNFKMLRVGFDDLLWCGGTLACAG